MPCMNWGVRGQQPAASGLIWLQHYLMPDHMMRPGSTKYTCICIPFHLMSISDVELAIVLEMLSCALVCKGKEPIQNCFPAALVLD